MTEQSFFPAFPDFENFGLKHKNILNLYLKKYPPQISELTFTNLFCWSRQKGLKISLFQEAIILLSEPEKAEPYFFYPIGDCNIKEFIEILKDNKNIPHKFKLVPENMLSHFSNFEITEDRDNWDYVYNTTDLKYLKGRKFSRKRNFIKQFLKKYDGLYEMRKIDSSKILNLANFLLRWCNQKECKYDIPRHLEYEAILRCFENWEHFDCIGAGIYINGKMEGFTVAEPLNENTIVIHFEKAMFSYKGLYQLINRDFLLNFIDENEYPFINREQDMGIKGLRKAKMSYYPVKFIKKYTVEIK